MVGYLDPNHRIDQEALPVQEMRRNQSLFQEIEALIPKHQWRIVLHQVFQQTSVQFLFLAKPMSALMGGGKRH